MEIESKKCACKGGNLDRFIQPIILLILTDGPDTGYGIFKRVGGFSMFREEKPDATGIYRYLRIMEKEGFWSSLILKKAIINIRKNIVSPSMEGNAC